MKYAARRCQMPFKTFSFKNDSDTGTSIRPLTTGWKKRRKKTRTEKFVLETKRRLLFRETIIGSSSYGMSRTKSKELRLIFFGKNQFYLIKKLI